MNRKQDCAVSILCAVFTIPLFINKKLASKAVLRIVDLFKILIGPFEVAARGVEQGQVVKIGKGVRWLPRPIVTKHGGKLLARGYIKD